MSDEYRVILIDAEPNSRQALKRQLADVRQVEVVEAVSRPETAAARVAAVGPDVALVALGEGAAADDALRLVEVLRQAVPGVPVFAAGSDHDPTLILRSIRAGAREFLPTPLNSHELIEALERVRPRANPVPKGPRVVAVTGAAGGIGCSSLAVSLSSSLAKMSGCDTVIADFDLLAGSLEESLGVVPDNSLEVLVRNLDDIDGAMLKRWLPRHGKGLYVLPHPVMMEEAVRMEPHELQRVLTLLRDTFATVFVDTSKGLQATDFVAFEAADVIIVVLQLNLNCVRNTYRLVQYLRGFEGYEQKVRLVVNRLNSPLSEIGMKKAEDILKCQIHWTVPNATRLFMPARLRGLPIDEVEGGQNSKAHQALLEIAAQLQPFPPDPAKVKRRLFSAFL